MSVELPPSVELTVLETEPGLKGSTVSNVNEARKDRHRPGCPCACVYQ